MSDWHPDTLRENAHARIDPPTVAKVCPTCGSDDPMTHITGTPQNPNREWCFAPFHAVPEQ